MLMALAGFLTFGDKTLGNVLNNFSTSNIMVNVARLCFGLNMLTTLPLEAFVCREVMLELWFRDKPFNMMIHVIFSTGLVVGAMAVSLLTCDIGVVFELVGSTSAAALAYILPPLCYIKLSTRSWRTGIAVGIIVFGCLVMSTSIIQAVMKIVRGEFSFLHPRIYTHAHTHTHTHIDTVIRRHQPRSSFFSRCLSCLVPSLACLVFFTSLFFFFFFCPPLQVFFSG